MLTFIHGHKPTSVAGDAYDVCWVCHHLIYPAGLHLSVKTFWEIDDFNTSLQTNNYKYEGDTTAYEGRGVCYVQEKLITICCWSETFMEISPELLYKYQHASSHLFS